MINKCPTCGRSNDYLMSTRHERPVLNALARTWLWILLLMFLVASVELFK